MTTEQFLRIREGDRWVALRTLDANPVSSPVQTAEKTAAGSDFGLLRTLHLRHDALIGTRHT